MPSRRRFAQALSVSLLIRATAHGQEPPVDVAVYGGTPAGIAAAIAAAREGARVMLVEPSRRIGGLVTSGLSHTDFRTFEGLTGAFLEFSREVLAHYRSTYGPASPQAEGCFRGTHAEPKVNLAVLERLLAREPRIQVIREYALLDVRMSGRRILSARFKPAAGNETVIEAAQWIDATYEGDLMAAAGVPFRVGREGKAEYGESLAPGRPDGQLQGYNFRFVMTRDPENRVTPLAPPGYRREDFTGVLALLADGRIRRVFAYTPDAIYKDQIPPLPNSKVDINDVSHSPVRLSMPGRNLGWPEGDHAARRRIFDEHLRWSTGLLYFLQNDEGVPVRFRDEARAWGWCKDEFTDSNHLPPQLYVREARRMLGLRIFTERDTEHAPGDARSLLHRDSVAMGDYGHNCHGTAREGTLFEGKHTGEFYKQIVPYQIPYGTLAPREVENLLVPAAASASHVGFCALRLEPIWMSMGQAAGHAAWEALARRSAVQKIGIARIQQRLHEQGAATIYVSDVPPGHPDFAAVQWWGTAGGLHRLEPMPEKPGQRGRQIAGQYFEAFPGHAAGLERPLDEARRKIWQELALGLGVPAAALTAVKARTRGDWIRVVWRLRPSSPASG